MPNDLKKTKIYHITDINNLSSIIEQGGLLSDAKIIEAKPNHAVIGYDHIKERRLTQIQVTCCDNRYVGEFVPFYYCPRSPMLFTINQGNTGRKPGCQKDIVHLVSTVGEGVETGRDWAISDGNAGAFYTSFSNRLDDLNCLNWEVINSNSWGGERRHQKASEFLVADFFPWSSFVEIGCYDKEAASRVKSAIADSPCEIPVRIFRNWYY